jgi:1,4-dihydroxy-2-naphthoate octaprenyltransferase
MVNFVSLCDIKYGFVPKNSTDLFVKRKIHKLPSRGDVITRLPVFGSNARENLNAKPRRNLRVRPIFCKSYGDAAKVYQEEEIPRAKLIWRAIKLPMYSVALVPLTVCFLKKPFYVLHCLYLLGNIHCSNVTQVGASAAYLETGLFLARRYVTLLLSSILIITWLNLR